MTGSAQEFIGGATTAVNSVGMRLVIHSMEEAVLDGDMIKILFINSRPVALVRRFYDVADRWVAYHADDLDKDTVPLVTVWLDDYAPCEKCRLTRKALEDTKLCL